MSDRGDAVHDLDLFVDLSSLSWSSSRIVAHVDALRRYCGYAGVTRICISIPQEFKGGIALDRNILWAKGAHAFGMALRRAGSDGRPLLILLGAILPQNECLPSLRQALTLDPLLGSAQPRFSDASDDAIYCLSTTDEVTRRKFERDVLFRLPPTVITAEMLSACTLVRAKVVEAIASDEYPDHLTVSGVVLAALINARRRGFRNIVVNRSVVHATRSGAAYPTVSRKDAEILDVWRPDFRRAVSMNQNLGIGALENAISAIRNSNGRFKLLIDCRGVAPVHNGTSRCILGLLDGLASFKEEWEMHVLTGERAFEFHAMQRRYPMFKHIHSLPTTGFAAALLPNQPWSLKTIAELHRHSWALCFNMLDTIAWDVIYPLADEVDAPWRFMAEFADGVSYNSEYTKKRVAMRFPISPGRIESVVHHSLSPADHTHPTVERRAQADHVLLFGNAYDHKDLGPTISLLADAFPEQSFVVLGGLAGHASRSNIANIASGSCPEEDVHALIQNARCVVYPSFYEGFGLPVVESLSYGQVVFARHSELWFEIVSHSRLPGRVVPFTSNLNLVEMLGRHLAGQSVPYLPSGSSLPPERDGIDWTGSAKLMISFIERCIENANAQSWVRREYALRVSGL